MEHSGFLRAMWTVLFLAVCAWLGAWLFSPGSAAGSAESVLPERSEEVCLSGFALRREERIYFDREPVSCADDGRRIPSGGTVACFSDAEALYASRSCVFYRECDGYEYLSPEDGENITVSVMERLLSLPPEKGGGGRIVTDYVWYFAALAEDGDALPGKGYCTLCFEDIPGAVPAQIISISPPEEGKRALLLRLTAGGDYLKLRKCRCTLR